MSNVSVPPGVLRTRKDVSPISAVASMILWAENVDVVQKQQVSKNIERDI